MSVYTRNQPVATDSLTVSQPFLANNTNAADDAFGADHYQFSNVTLNRGFHKKVTLVDQTASVPVPAAGTLGIYGITTAGITSSYYKRDGLSTVWPVSPIKAFAMVTGTGATGAQTVTNGFNIASVSRSGNVWTFTLTSPMKSSSSYAIFGFLNSGSIISFTTIDASNFSITTNAGAGVAGNIFNAFAMED